MWSRQNYNHSVLPLASAHEGLLCTWEWWQISTLKIRDWLELLQCKQPKAWEGYPWSKNVQRWFLVHVNQYHVNSIWFPVCGDLLQQVRDVNKLTILLVHLLGITTLWSSRSSVASWPEELVEIDWWNLQLLPTCSLLCSTRISCLTLSVLSVPYPVRFLLGMIRWRYTRRVVCVEFSLFYRYLDVTCRKGRSTIPS